MSKAVTIRYTNGETKKVVLGEEETCVSAEPRGWGTSCEALVLKKDGFYHCDDCGLVFKKPVEKIKSNETITVLCDCKQLVNFLEWFFDECFGYDCPISYYRCVKCGRVYKSPHYNRESSILLQESKAAKEHVLWIRKHQKEEQAERVQRAEDYTKELKKAFKQIPKAVRKKILRELAT